MTNEEILKKAINKAVNNGWKFPYKSEFIDNAGWFIGMNMLEHIIFSHDFAKAFWGTDTFIDPFCPPNMVYYLSFQPDFSLPAWQYHLQLMVLEPEPLKYLEQFLKEDK